MLLPWRIRAFPIMHVRADGCSSRSSRQISRISCRLTSADKPDYFVTSRPTAFQALKPPAMERTSFVIHLLQAVGGERGVPKAFGAAMANDPCVRVPELFHRVFHKLKPRAGRRGTCRTMADKLSRQPENLLGQCYVDTSCALRSETVARLLARELQISSFIFAKVCLRACGGAPALRCG
jgi:hypothetical protein